MQWLVHNLLWVGKESVVTGDSQLHSRLLSTAARVNWNAKQITFSSFTSSTVQCALIVRTLQLFNCRKPFHWDYYASPRQQTVKSVLLQCKYVNSNCHKFKYLVLPSTTQEACCNRNMCTCRNICTCRNMYIPGRNCSSLRQILLAAWPQPSLFLQML